MIDGLGGLFIQVMLHADCLAPVCFLFLGDFLREPHVYEDLLDFKSLKRFIESQLEDYNLTPGVVPMNLVPFRDAIEHG